MQGVVLGEAGRDYLQELGTYFGFNIGREWGVKIYYFSAPVSFSFARVSFWIKLKFVDITTSCQCFLVRGCCSIKQLLDMVDYCCRVVITLVYVLIVLLGFMNGL